jgi:hypothetical protein
MAAFEAMLHFSPLILSGARLTSPASPYDGVYVRKRIFRIELAIIGP